MSGYFDEHLISRQLLFWSVTTRRQLDRWEACVAEIVSLGLRNEDLPGDLIWRSEGERHLVFVAAANLARACELPGSDAAAPDLLPMLKDMRNVLEHWDENLPAFNVSPKGVPPGPSGKRFAESFPESTPWSLFAWSSKDGPMLLPKHIPALSLHQALDHLDAWVLSQWPSMARLIPGRPPSPWFGGDVPMDRWYPKASDASG